MSGVIDFSTPAAGFDQPIDMWLACHERVLRMSNLLVRLRDHIAAGEPGDSAAITATSILRYFEEAAPRHHEDEEADLFPRLLARSSGAELERLRRLVDDLRAEHVDVDAQWIPLREQLREIEAGRTRPLERAQVDRFVACYTRHVECENDELSPAFRRAFARAELDAIGRSMAARRGVDWDTLVARR